MEALSIVHKEFSVEFISEKIRSGDLTEEWAIPVLRGQVFSMNVTHKMCHDMLVSPS